MIMRKTLIDIITAIVMLTILEMSTLFAPAASPYAQSARTLRATASATATRIIADGTRARPLLNPCTGRPFHTIMSNGGFKDVQPHVSSFDPSVWVVTFTLASNNEARAFSEHTRT